jgi:hypothetical protein
MVFVWLLHVMMRYKMGMNGMWIVAEVVDSFLVLKDKIARLMQIVQAGCVIPQRFNAKLNPVPITCRMVMKQMWIVVEVRAMPVFLLDARIIVNVMTARSAMNLYVWLRLVKMTTSLVFWMKSMLDVVASVVFAILVNFV